MWNIKLGGSWLTNPNLKALLIAIKKFKKVPITLVVGGGMFADSIRNAQKHVNFDDKFANSLALKSTEQYASIINKIAPYIYLTSKLSLLRSEKNIKIWLPSKYLSKEKKCKKKWESTSDSIACWLCSKIKSDGVIFIKSLSFENKKSLKLIDLQKKGIIDRNILSYVRKKTCLKIVGPEVLELLQKKKDWSEVIENIKSIKL